MSGRKKPHQFSPWLPGQAAQPPPWRVPSTNLVPGPRTGAGGLAMRN